MRRIATAIRRLAILLVLALAVTAESSRAQSRDVAPRPRPAEPAAVARPAGEAWAVVIGINDYRHERIPKLRYAVNDARSVERALVRLGFRPERITTLLDGAATKAQIEVVLGDELHQKVGPDDRVLVFFAGHGKTDRLRSGEEEGYLIPVDGDPARLFSTAISMTAIRQISDRLPARHILYIVDACYSGYAVFNRAISEELLEEMVRKPAIQVLTAGRQGDQAQEKAGHGVFTDVLVRGLEGEAFGGKGWLALEELGLWVKQRVYAESERRQLPQYGSLSGEGQFVFVRPGGATVRPAAAVPGPAALGALSLRTTVADLEVWLDDRKLPTLRPAGALVVSELQAGTYRLRATKSGYRDWQRQVVVAADQRAEVTIDIEAIALPRTIRVDDGAEMMLVAAGEFWMGSAPDDLAEVVQTCSMEGASWSTCRDVPYQRHELPRRRVHLDGFYLDRYEVTNARFAPFVSATQHRTTAEERGVGAVWTYQAGKWEWSQYTPGATWRRPSGRGTAAVPADHPVVQVSWTDADAYCRWAGKRLPTEAEWEKAARGAEGRRYPWGEGWQRGAANIAGASYGTAPVGKFPSSVSPYDVHDMAGNVWEWVADWYDPDYYRRAPLRNPSGPEHGSYRVERGGGFLDAAITARAAARWRNPPAYSVNHLGFRCAKSS